MGQPSMRHQVLKLAHEHDKRGESKHDTKVEGLKSGISKEELTRDGFYSSSSKQDWIDICSRFAQDMKREFGTKRLGDIRHEHYEKWFNARADSWSGSTQETFNDHIKRLSLFVREKGWGNGFYGGKPSRMLVHGKALAYRGDRSKPWDPESFKDLVSSLPEKYIPVLIVMRETGMRSVEIQRMRWGDIGSEKLRINGKGGRVRFVPLTEVARKILEALPGDQSKPFAHINIDSMRKAIYRHNKRAGLPSRNLHSIRHLFAREQFMKEYSVARRKETSERRATKVARGRVSLALGHGRPWQESGRVSVTYAYISGSDSRELTEFHV